MTKKLTKNCIKFFYLLLVLLFATTNLNAQVKSTSKYNLGKMFREDNLILNGNTVTELNEKGKEGISSTGIVWLKDVMFSEGIIEVDLRGKDIFQKSFIGIAFHGTDTSTYDAIYFRPFNFRANDSIRRIHAVQYMSLPDHEWYVLREEFPGKYENSVIPTPPAAEWFHAKIMITVSGITVFVNDSKTPSLIVDKLNTRNTGKIGLWNVGEPGSFANLSVTKLK